MKKYILLFLFCIIVIPFKVKAECMPFDTSKSGYQFDTSFYKMERRSSTINKGEIDEGYYLSGASFKFTSIDGSYTFNTNQEYVDNMYVLNASKETTAQELINLLPQQFKDELNNVHSLSDIDGLDSVDCANWCDSENNCYHTAKTADFTIPIKLVETKAPDGFKKQDFVYIVKVKIFFNYKPDETTIDNVQMIIENSRASFRKAVARDIFYDYVPDFNYWGYITENTSPHNYLFNNNINYYEGEIYNDALPAELKIENYIEGKSTYDTSSNTKVSYKIVVSNTGGKTAFNNVVRIVIPDKLQVDESSISNDGVYLAETRAIMWNIGDLNRSSYTDLYFDIIVPKEVKGEYRLASSVESPGLTLSANKTTLKVSDPLDNPNTGDSDAEFLIIMLLVISSISLVFVNKKYILLNN